MENNKINNNHYLVENKNIKELIDSLIAEHKGADAFDIGNIIKYITRFKKKDGINDLIKARNYLDLLINRYSDPASNNNKTPELNQKEETSTERIVLNSVNKIIS